MTYSNGLAYPPLCEGPPTPGWYPTVGSPLPTHRLQTDVHHEGVDVVLSLWQFAQEGHHVQLCVLEEPETQGWEEKKKKEKASSGETRDSG